MFWKRKILTPPASILQDQPKQTNQEQVQDITPFINTVSPSEMVRVTEAPQTIVYHYNLQRLSDVTKLGRVEKITTAATGQQTIVTTPGNGCHYTVAVPRQTRQIIPFKRCLLTRCFDDADGLSFIAGKDQQNLTRCYDLATLPHLLIAGTTGSGKSVVINNIIGSLLFKHTPETLSLVLIDCKRVELSPYAGIPHLYCPVVTSPAQASTVLCNLCGVMDQRYRVMEKKHQRTSTDPALVVVVDELADLMLTGKKAIETPLIRLAQLGRAANIHLILATQRPTASVITGLISANIPGKICLKCAKVTDSVLILGHKGGETLTGCGDCIIKTPDTVTETRLQSPLITDQDIRQIVRYWHRPEKAS